ncbi:putative beta-lysine N-acetyltransferase [Bacillus sp. RD4P76]|uniref:Beta-lysine N-acetyltransferase n=1 Tax=Bacillus suaedaesalsae TaxID=2810349 RepID=A0ABS2DP39_9BACI|nr:putative beta-lysine N-acetyltransferase [Bacillus suaedaesalsae]
MIEGEYFYLSVCFDHFNQRIRLDDYRGNLSLIADKVIELASKHSYSKAILYSRREHVHCFVEKGFLLEAIFEGFFHGSHAYALTMYFESARKKSDSWLKEDKILQDVLSLPVTKNQGNLPSGYKLRKGTPIDAEMLAGLYKEVFQVYPTPLNDPGYIKKIMKSNTVFYVIEKEGVLVSSASACIDYNYANAEISDCATLPEHRSHGLMKHLIVRLEKELISQKIFCAYSIARALSFGMNASLKQLGYKYKGRMMNNCYIYDKLEDMNVWVKDLS